ncbi:hypothetical protein HDU85_007266 [Gaertneriomyces sp. JEL0708]|nr:hypothetical protein HDU85_007266 [Gaertneriomyces sp. JEL0708]
MIPLPSFEEKALTDVDNLVKNKFGKKYPTAENDTKANAVHVLGTVLGADGLPVKNFTKRVVNHTLRVKGAPPQDAHILERRQASSASPDDMKIWWVTNWLYIGGNGGGSAMSLWEAGPITKFDTWAGCCGLVGIRTTQANGLVSVYGRINSGTYESFTFDQNEKIVSLSLWSNGVGTRIGAIMWTTNIGRVFHPKMTLWELKREYSYQNVGSGIIAGIHVRHAHEIDALGFVFLQSPHTTQLQDIDYLDGFQDGFQAQPTGSGREQGVAVDVNNIGSATPRSAVVNTSLALTTAKTLTFTQGLEFGMNIKISGGLPGLVKNENTFSWKIAHSFQESFAHTSAVTYAVDFPFECPPNRFCTTYIEQMRFSQSGRFRALVAMYMPNGSWYAYTVLGSISVIDTTQYRVVPVESMQILLLKLLRGALGQAIAQAHFAAPTMIVLTSLFAVMANVGHQSAARLEARLAAGQGEVPPAALGLVIAQGLLAARTMIVLMTSSA